MNKKFSTLVASVLLAGAVGTVNATVYDSYVKSAALATASVKTVANGVTYQISDGTKVLVMTEGPNGTMLLRMVAPANADLMSSLWTIATSDDGEGGVSYTFINKATGLPLAFGTEGVKVNETTSNAMGNVSLWKWRTGVAVQGKKDLVSYFHKDSAMVLVKNGDAVSAQKVYARNATPTSNFEVDAYVAESVTLGVNALNSMLGVQPTDGKMKLGFTRDQVNGVDNIWLNEYTAVEALGGSSVAQAAKKAVEVAQGLVSADAVVDAINNSIGNNYTAEQVEAVQEMAKAAAEGKDATEAKTKAEAKAKEYVDAAAEAVKVADLVKEYQTAIDALKLATVGEYEEWIETTAAAADETTLNALKGYGADGLVSAKAAITQLKGELTTKESALKTSKATVDGDIWAAGVLGDGAWESGLTTYAEVVATLETYANGVSGEDLEIANSVIAFFEAKTQSEAVGTYSTDKAAADVAIDAHIKEYTDNKTAVTAAESGFDTEWAKSVLNKADYDVAIDNVSPTAAPENADDIEAEVKALVKDDASLKAIPQVAIAQMYVSYQTAASELGAVSSVATVAKDAIPTLAAGANDVKNAINAIDQTYYDNDQKAAITALANAAVGANVEDAIKAVVDLYEENYKDLSSDFVSLLSTKDASDAKKNTYLRVDTTYLANVSSDKYQLAFAVGTFNSALKNSKKQLVDARLQEDFNGRYSFKFTYYPTQDSLMIEPASYIYPFTDKAYADITNTEVDAAKNKDDYAGQQVKLAILANDHREVTIGKEDKANTTGAEATINTRIYLGGSSNYERTTLASGVYFFNLVTDLKSRQDDNGKFRVVTYCGDNWKAYEAEETTQRFGKAQDFNHIPRTQWVVEQNEGVAGIQTVTITNREFGARYNNVQLYKAGDNVFAQVGAFANTASVIDTLAYTKVADKYTTDKYLGYKKFEKALDYEKFYNLDYLSGMELGNYVSFKGDSSVYVDLKGGKTFIEFVPASEDTEFGYSSTKAGAVQLNKAAYALRVHNETLLTTGSYYVTTSKDGKSYVITHETSGITPSYFVLKENNELVSEEGDTTCYYALQEVARYIDDKKFYVDANWNRVGVRDASMAFTVEESCYYVPEKRIATFAVVEDNTPLYRRLGVSKADDGFKDMTVQTGKIYTVNSAAKEYLYEDAYSKYSTDKNGKSLGINFLGLEGKGINAKSAMFVDTAYVRGNTNMPQYMLVMNPQIVKADTVWCNATSTHKHATLADSLACPHTTITPASITGRYLINAEDSVAAGDNNYVWNTKYTRLAFVDAKHIGDTLVIFRNGKASTASKDSIFLGNNDHNKATTARPNGIKNPVFAFRLVNADACDFLIESAGDHKIPSDGTGKWVAVKNGVPVVAAMETYTDAIRDAEIFNIEPTEEIATSNDAITAGEVSVIAGDAKVIIKGAAGKTVVISNLLGQTIANTVLSSDNAEIAAPAGVVVVAVEGEAAVKAIVK